jgi:sugar phosphate isomerase/epimerase
MVTKHSIKRGASLYSFQEEYFLRKMTLEDIIAAAAKLDIQGIEIIGDQMIPGYPNAPESFFDQWHGWMEKYHVTPTCLDMFLDWNKFKGRSMTFEEKVESVRKDIHFANRLGCKVIRVITHTEPEVLERLAPEAEKYDVKLGVEIHSPFHFDHEYEQRLVAMYQKVQSPYLGFVPDMGIFVKRFPRVISDRWIRDGMKTEIAQFITQSYDRHEGLEHIGEDVEKMGSTPEDIGKAKGAGHFIYTNPRRILDFMQYVHHIHAKFYEMLPDYTEYSIPYEDIIPVLIEGGYNGYLSSEYEGNRHIQDAFEVDSVEQVRRQQVMFKRLLGEE